MPYKNETEQALWHKRWREANVAELQAYKESLPCTDCGKYFSHYITEFDHVPERGRKVAKIGSLIHGRSFQAATFQKELAKCDLVCANCHRIRTYNRVVSQSAEEAASNTA